MTPRERFLISTEALHAQLNAPDLVVVDASWYLPTMSRDANSEYRARRIPGAVRFDLDAVSDRASSLPHMMPPTHVFASNMRKLGIGDGQKIVVYDGLGLFSAPRAWWMFRTMGVDDVAVLDGGFRKWEAEGRPVDDLPPRPRGERHFTARLDNGAIRDANAVEKALAREDMLVLDARPADRFRGDAPEPRPGVRAGHMPGSVSLPFSDLVAEDGTLLPDVALAARLKAAGWSPDRPVITSCGSGVTAAVITFALTMVGASNLGLYDGAWAEWGSDESRLIATGHA